MSSEMLPGGRLDKDSSAAQRELLVFLSLLKPMKVEGFAKVRVGDSNDGGYVMVDDFDPEVPCYSIGVGGDVSWDLDLADRGMSIFQYDHTVDGPPVEHPRFHFNRFGISDDPKWSPDLKGLNEILQDNGHASADDLILKIDVEGAEWNIFDRLPPGFLRPFRQIVCEFHWLNNLADKDFRDRAIRVFQSLDATHAVLHVHANNFAPLGVVEGVPVAGVIEVSFVTRDRYKLLESLEIFPTPIDKPNNPEQPDIFLGDFRYQDLTMRDAAVVSPAEHAREIKRECPTEEELQPLIDRLVDKLLTTPRIFGDPAGLSLGPGCNPVNTLFNLVSGSVTIGAMLFSAMT